MNSTVSARATGKPALLILCVFGKDSFLLLQHPDFSILVATCLRLHLLMTSVDVRKASSHSYNLDRYLGGNA